MDNIVFARLPDAGKMLAAKIKGIEKKGSFTKISIGIYLVDFYERPHRNHRKETSHEYVGFIAQTVNDLNSGFPVHPDRSDLSNSGH